MLVHKFVCRGTVEEKIDALIAGEARAVATSCSRAAAEVKLTELDDDELLELVVARSAGARCWTPKETSMSYW